MKGRLIFYASVFSIIFFNVTYAENLSDIMENLSSLYKETEIIKTKSGCDEDAEYCTYFLRKNKTLQDIISDYKNKLEDKDWKSERIVDNVMVFLKNDSYELTITIWEQRNEIEINLESMKKR